MFVLEFRSFQPLKHPGGIGRHHGGEYAIFRGVVTFSATAFQHGSMSRRARRETLRSGSGPRASQLPRRPFAGSGQLDGHFAARLLDKLPMEAKPLAPHEDEHRPEVESTQREPAVGIGANRSPLGPVAGLKDHGVRDRLALAVDDTAAECA